MGLATANASFNRVAAPDRRDNSATPHEPHNTIDQKQNNPLPETSSAQSRYHFEIAARATNDAVRDWDLTSRSLHWPQGLDTLLGYEQAFADGEIGFWEQRVHPGDRTRITASIRDAIANGAERWNSDYRFRHAQGNYLHLLERALIVRDQAGQAVRFVGSLMDITARKQLHDQLTRSQKMEAFGQLAGGLAHDFNNFLTTILGYSDLILGETGTTPIVASHVTEIRSAAGRASNLAGQLLAFSRKQALEPHVVEVNSLIANLERSLLRLLGDNITVVCHLHRESAGAHIKVDSGQLTQIILNLAVNARDAMHNGGRLTLATTTAKLGADGQSLSGLEDLAPGDYVVISVIDTGVGMSDEVKAHLFEPFFTTKDEGTGSGLGLATSYGIIYQSGGRIRIDSELGAGTTVQIFLPKVAAPPPPNYRKPIGKNLLRGTETILVLEDDISVRHLSVRILRDLGYEVIEAANGDDAQRQFTGRAGRNVDLLLTDLVMPDTSGRSFADWVLKASPLTRVVFVSGYLTESLHPGERIENGMFFLPKPFDPEQLATTIREALDSAVPSS
jgi:two-component system, cell cycle sensor histidine kinase and response regulator CckA